MTKPRVLLTEGSSLTTRQIGSRLGPVDRYRIVAMFDGRVLEVLQRLALERQTDNPVDRVGRSPGEPSV